MARFSAMLLFQFRVETRSGPSKRRICEQRLILIEAANPKAAIKKAIRRGRSAECSYFNSDGNQVNVEFVGLLDFLKLGVECEADEVWYGICEMLEPMERREKIVLSDADLNRLMDLES